MWPGALMNGGLGPEIPIWLLDSAETGASGYTTQQLLGWTRCVGGMEAPSVGPERGKSLRKDHGLPLGRATRFVATVSTCHLFFWKRIKTGSRTHMVMAVNVGERCAAAMSKTEWRWASRGSCESTWKSRSIEGKRSINGIQWDLS